MDSMDLDFDDFVGHDPIQKFLNSKLDEIKSANASLKDELKARNELLNGCKARCSLEEIDEIKLWNLWKRAFYSKCVFGIQATCRKRTLELVQVVLNWDCPNPLTYTVKLYDKNEFEECIPTCSIGDDTIMLVALERPPFHKQISFTLTGFIKYRNGEGFVCQTPFPSLGVCTGDFLDPSSRPISGPKDDILICLTCLAASDMTELVGKTVGKRKPESVLEIDCMFRKLDVKSRKKYFVVDGVSPTIDGCLVELEDGSDDGVFRFNVLTRSREQLIFLLHHLHRSVERFSVLPKSYETHLRKSVANESFSREDREGEEKEEDKACEDFRRALLQEIGHLENFCATGDYVKFRKELTELEVRTDVLRAECDF